MSFVVVDVVANVVDDVVVATFVFKFFRGPDGPATDARFEVLKKLEEYHLRGVHDLPGMANGGVVMLVEGLCSLPVGQIRLR